MSLCQLRSLTIAGLAALLCGLATSAAAQGTGTPAAPNATQPPPEFRPYWELEIFGGSGSASSGGFSPVSQFQPDVRVPAPGGGTVSQVSSWLLPPFSGLSSIQSLAAVVHGPIATGPARGVMGLRVSRWGRRHVGLEFTGSFAPGSPAQLSGATLAAIEESRSSFVSAFNGLFAASPALYTAPSVTATTATNTSGGGQFEAAAALAVAKAGGRVRPYASVGFGARGWMGAVETVNVTGRYTFMTSAGAPIDETDSVTLRYGGGWTTVAAFGGGARLMLGPRSGVRVDVALTTGMDPDVVTVDEQPSSRTGTPAGFVLQPGTRVNVPIVFSNTPAQPTTLGGPPILNQTSATGHGWRSVWALSAGWFWRF